MSDYMRALEEEVEEEVYSRMTFPTTMHSLSHQYNPFSPYHGHVRRIWPLLSDDVLRALRLRL